MEVRMKKIIILLFTVTVYFCFISISFGDILEASTIENECIPDYNMDGLVDTADLIDKVEYDIIVFASWASTCFNYQRPCGDYNGDGVISNDDLILKSLDMVEDLAEWVFTCWIPEMDPGTKEVYDMGVFQIEKFKKSANAIIRSFI